MSIFKRRAAKAEQKEAAKTSGIGTLSSKMGAKSKVHVSSTKHEQPVKQEIKATPAPQQAAKKPAPPKQAAVKAAKPAAAAPTKQTASSVKPAAAKAVQPTKQGKPQGGNSPKAEPKRPAVNTVAVKNKTAKTGGQSAAPAKSGANSGHMVHKQQQPKSGRPEEAGQKSPVYIRCPRCELNFILKKDKFCNVCKQEMKTLGGGADESFDLELCPICHINYINADEDMCVSCARERDAEDTEGEEGWEDEFAERDGEYSEEEERGEMVSITDLDDSPIDNEEGLNLGFDDEEPEEEEEVDEEEFEGLDDDVFDDLDDDIDDDEDEDDDDDSFDDDEDEDEE